WSGLILRFWSQRKRDMKEKALNLQDFISGELSEKSKCEEDRDRREKGKLQFLIFIWSKGKIRITFNVCEEAWCPSIGKCWAGGEYATATVMVSVLKEPYNTAKATAAWGQDYVVLTSVHRDDIPASSLKERYKNDKKIVSSISLIHDLFSLRNTKVLVECLTPDFREDLAAVEKIALSVLDVYAHDKHRQHVHDPRANFNQLRDSGVDCLTLGQYTQPTKCHLKEEECVTPEKFAYWEKVGQMGFVYTASGPLVRFSHKQVT
uniref:Lipoic acid synthetase n=1 Tax=Cyprinus carpio carpio TaxID=630221 RepID=A0A9J8CRE5_CYPCA